MTQQERQTDSGVRIMRAADRAARGSYFASEVAGNRVASFGVVELGSGRLKLHAIKCGHELFNSKVNNSSTIHKVKNGHRRGLEKWGMIVQELGVHGS